MPLSDSSETCMRVVRPKPSPAGLLSACPTGVLEVSRFSCLKFLGVPRVYDYAGPSGMLAFTLPVHVAFRLAKDVGALIARFRSSIPRPPMVGIELGRVSSTRRFPRPPYNPGRPDFPGPV